MTVDRETGFEHLSPCQSSNEAHLHRRRRLLFSPSNIPKQAEERERNEVNVERESVVNMFCKRDEAEITTKKRDSTASCAAFRLGSSLMKNPPASTAPICSPQSSITRSSSSDELYYSQASTDFPCDDEARSKTESPASSMAEGMKPELCEEEEEEGSEEEEERREMVEILHQQILGKTVSMKRFEGEEAKQNLIWRCKSKMANFVFNFEEEEDADYDEMMMLRKSLERAHVRVWGPSTNFDNTPQQHHKKPVPAPAEDAHLLHNPHSLEVSSGYLASNDSICEASESTSARYNHNSKAENGTLDNTECGQMDIKLCAWKEYEIMKIFAKLNRKENKINDWECKKKTQARNRFNKVQMNLDIKRQKALEAMEKRTAKIEKRADVKRVRERSRSMRKTSRIEAVTGSIRTTGNIPWKLWLF